MGSTTKITTSKNLSFKKLSFLYLVFILFLFFSSPGQYVVHYTQIAKTQKELNQRLLTKLKTYNSENPDELNLKNVTIECLSDLSNLEEKYVAYADKNKIYGDRIKENHFAEKEVRKGSLAKVFNSIIDKYKTAFTKVSSRDISSDIEELTDFSSNKMKSVEFFFHETPNGVVNSIFEHFKTVFLYNSLIDLTHQNIDIPKFELITLEEANFIQKFRRTFILGEQLQLAIKPEKSGSSPTVKINGNILPVSKNAQNNFEVKYNPASAGRYSLEVELEGKRLLTGFEVLKPEFRFFVDKSSVEAVVGEKAILSIDTQYFPTRNVEFSATRATIKRVKNHLEIIPLEEGVFEISMKYNGEFADKVDMYAHAPSLIEVGLLDVSGKLASLEKANRLESKNTFWQVVNFNMTVVDPSGNKTTLKSATRYLRNELRQLENSAASGSTIIFDNIKLVGQKPDSYMMGKPLIMTK